MRRIPMALAGALLLTSVLLPVPAFAASTSHARITTLASSSQYIVYEQKSSTKNLTPGDISDATLYAADATGKRMTLPGFDIQHRGIVLTGSMVVQAQNSLHTAGDHQTVRWFDLNTRRGGTWTGEADELLLAAAPDGWLTERSTGTDGRYGPVQRISYVHRDGSRTDLGIPYPDGQVPGLTTSDTGIIATPGVSDEQRFRTKVLFQPWTTADTTWRTLLTTKDEQVGISCAPSSASTVACVRSPEEGEGEGPFTYGLISLTGGGARWMVDSHPRACQRILFATLGSNLVAVENSDTGVCTKGKLYRFTWSGGLVVGGSHHYSSTSLLTGLGGASGGAAKIIVSSLEQRHIDTLTGVTRAPKILVRV